MTIDEYLVRGANYHRLVREYHQYGYLVIGFDFDGTVHDYHNTGASYEMVRQLLRDLKSIDCKLICWTAHKDLNYVKEFLERNNIPCDSINEGGIPLPWKSKKPFFSALLDDRAGLIEIFDDLTALVRTVKH